jgi:hypothetical protein
MTFRTLPRAPGHHGREPVPERVHQQVQHDHLQLVPAQQRRERLHVLTLQAPHCRRTEKRATHATLHGVDGSGLARRGARVKHYRPPVTRAGTFNTSSATAWRTISFKPGSARRREFTIDAHLTAGLRRASGEVRGQRRLHLSSRSTTTVPLLGAGPAANRSSRLWRHMLRYARPAQGALRAPVD